MNTANRNPAPSHHEWTREKGYRGKEYVHQDYPRHRTDKTGAIVVLNSQAEELEKLLDRQQVTIKPDGTIETIGQPRKSSFGGSSGQAGESSFAGSSGQAGKSSFAGSSGQH